MQIMISKQLNKSPGNPLRPCLALYFAKGAGDQVKPKEMFHC